MRSLFVSSFPPLPNNNGSRQRTKLIADGLAALGEVDLCLHCDWAMPAGFVDQVAAAYSLKAYQISPDPAHTPFFPLMALSHPLAYKLAHLYTSRRRYYAPRKKFAQAVEQLCAANQYDLVVGRYFRCSTRSALFAQPRVCIDVDDVDWEYFESQAAAPGTPSFHRWLFRRHATALRRLMDEKLRGAELAWVTKDEDLPRLNAKRVRVLPNVVDTTTPPADGPSEPSSPNLLYIGTLAWHPHRLGLLRFIEKILPRIAAQYPEVALRVISSECPESFGQKLKSFRHVEFLGRVGELAPYYRTCSYSVVPMYFGAGSHIKILESLYFGATCVVTAFGHRGYESTLRAGDCLLRADHDEAFAESCLKLLTDPALRERLARRGLEIVKKDYTPAVFTERVRDTVGELGL